MASGQSRADRDHRKERAKSIRARPRTEQHREQVRTRCVVRHFAHCDLKYAIVNRVTRALDVVHEQQVMREIGAVSRWQQQRPRDAQQPRRDGGNHTGPRDGIDVASAFRRTLPVASNERPGCDSRHRQ